MTSTLSAQDKVSQTAFDCAAARALAYADTQCESFDYLAIDLLRGPACPLKPKILATLVRRGLRGLARGVMSRVSPGADIFLFARTAVPDDLVRDALDADPSTQIVLLGAGLDTCGLRIGAERQRAGQPPGTFFEIDLATTQSEKRALVDRLVQRETKLDQNHIRYLPCSFGENELSKALVDAEFDRSRPTIWIWSGVVHYLTDEAVRSSIAELRDLSAPGSKLFFDFILLEAYDEPDVYQFRKIKKRFDAHGEVMSFGFRQGTEHVSQWLEEQGLEFVRSYTPRDMVALYSDKTGHQARSAGTPWSNLCVAEF